MVAAFAALSIATANFTTAKADTMTDITTSRVETQHVFHRALPWFGQVESLHAVDLIAQTNGLIVQVGAADEAQVKRGEVLFILAGKDVEGQAMDLQQQYQQALTEVALAKSDLALKQSQLLQGLATHEQVNRSKRALALARSHRSTARQAIIALHTGTKIMAPIAGVLTARHVHVGQYIQAGTPLARLVDVQHKRIRATVFAPDAVLLEHQSIYIDGKPNVLQAKVVSVMPDTTAEGATQLWIQGKGLDALPLGEKISGRLQQEHVGMAVPLSSIAHDDQGNSYVFIKTRQGWHQQRVKMGLYDQQCVEVTQGLKGDERLANSHAYALLYEDFSSHYQAPD